MAQADLVQDEGVLDYTLLAAGTNGDVLQVGYMAGILQGVSEGGATGDKASVKTKGLFDFRKDSSAFTSGAPIYWDSDGTGVDTVTGGAATATFASGNFYLGRATAAAGTAATTGRVALNEKPEQSIVSDLLDSTAGTASGTLSEVEGTYTQATVANNFASVNSQINSVIDALQKVGLMQRT